MSKSKKPRVRKVPSHRSFHLSKKKFQHPTILPSPLSLIKSSAKLIWSNKKLFAGIAGIQILLTYIFVQGFSSGIGVDELRQNIQEIVGDSSGITGQTVTALALFSYLVSSTSKSAAEAAGLYQLFLGIIISLAVIWGVRQLLANDRPTLRDVFYRGMYPLIPFICVLFVIGLQLIPALAGSLLYTSVFGNGLAVTPLEQVLWLIIIGLLVVLSVYMIMSSVFALYIVTLPDMTPIRALRSARQLVLHRRVSVFARLVSLPLVLLLIAMIVFIPLLIVFAPVAQPLFIVFSAGAFIFTHVYMCFLYRSLL